MRIHLSFAAIISSIILPLAATAQTDWQNSGTGDWFTSGNWNNGVPTSLQDAFIRDSGTAQIIGGAAQAQAVTLGTDGGAAGTLEITNGLLETSQITADGGNGSLLLNGGTLRPNAANSNFLAGFSSGSTILGGRGVIIDTAVDLGITNVFSGTAGLTKLGSGTLTLSGNNTYSGTTAINAGTVIAASNNALGADHVGFSPYNVTVTGSTAVLRINEGTTLNKVIRVEGFGTIDNRGVMTGALPAFSSDGAMIVNNTGTIIAGSAMFTQGSSESILTNTGGLIQGSDSGAVDFQGGTVINQGGGRIESASTTAVHITSGTFHSLTNTGSSTITGYTGVALDAGSLTNSAGSVISGTGWYGASIGTGSWLVQSSTVTNSGSSTIYGYETGVYVTNDMFSSVASTVNNSGGSLIHSSTTSDGIAGIYMTGGGGTIANSGSSTIFGRQYGVYVASDELGALSVVTNVSNTGGSFIGSGTTAAGIAGVIVTNYIGVVTNDATSSILGRRWGVRLEDGGAVNNSGVITGSLAVSATNAGVQIFGRSGTLTNSGTINGGVLLGNFSNAVTLNIGSLINGSLNIGTTNTSRLFLGGASGTGTYSSAVTGSTSFSGTLVKQGAGTWIIDQTFSSTRGVNITGGELRVGNGGTAGSISGNVANGGTLAVNRSDTFSLGGNISGTGRVLQIGTGTTVLSGSNSYTGGTTISAGTLQVGSGSTTGVISGNITNNATLAFNRTGTLTYSGVVSGSGSLVKTGTGALILSGIHTYTGSTSINSGRLSLSGSGALAASSRLNVDAGATFDLSSLTGAGATIKSLTGAGAITLGAKALTVGAAENTTFAGVISGAGGSLIKQGSGSLTLSGSNSYTGGTAIVVGKVFITDLGNGTSALGTGAVNVYEGATLGGNGTVLGVTSVSGILAPGNSPGSLHFASDLTLDGTAVIQMELADISNYDQIDVDGILTYDGTLSLALLEDYRPGIGDQFTLFAPGTYNPGTTFDDIIFDTAGYAGQMDYVTGVLTITAVPEPAVLALGSMGIALLLRRRRRA